MWEIVSYSDQIVINTVFNAIAAIFSNSLYTSAAIVVSIAVVMGIAVSSLATGQKEPPVTKWATGALLFSIGFTQTVTVAIENKTTGQIDLIDNIPFAIAAPASVITQISFHLTQMTETAFGNTDNQRITTNGYLSPMVMMAKYRKLAMHKECIAGNQISTFNGGFQLCPTLTNYARDCAAVKFARLGSGFIHSQQSALDIMAFDSKAHNTQIRKNGVNMDVSCSEAWLQIKPFLQGSNLDKLVEANRQILGKANSINNLSLQIDANLKAIAGDATDGRKLSQAIYTFNHMLAGTQAFLLKLGETAMAENFTSSLQLRNYTWIVQGSLFIEIMDLFLKIVESLLYAIAPFIGLMVLTGATGMQSFMMYIKVLIIFQLIPIMLVMVQNLILTQARAIYDNLISNHYELGSYEFMLTLTREMEKLAGMGGMLATTVVPALSFALVTGSNHALSSAIRYLGSSAKDTDFVTNHVEQGAAIHDLSSLTTTERRNNTHFTPNVEANMVSIDTKSILDNVVEQKLGLVEEKQVQYQQSLSNNQSAEYIKSQSQEEQLRIGEEILTGSSHREKAIQNFVSNFSQDQQFTRETQQLLSTELYAQLSTGNGLNLGIIKAEIEMGSKLAMSLSDTQKEALIQTLSDEKNQINEQELTQMYREARSKDLSEQQSVEINDAFIQQQNENIQRAFDDKTAAENALNRLSSLSESLSIDSTEDKVITNQTFANNPQIYARILEQYNNLSTPEQQQVHDNMAIFSAELNTLNEKEILTASMLKFVAESEQSADNFAYIISGETLFNSVDGIPPIQPRHLFDNSTHQHLNDLDEQTTYKQITQHLTQADTDTSLAPPSDKTNIELEKGKLVGQFQKEYDNENVGNPPSSQPTTPGSSSTSQQNDHSGMINDVPVFDINDTEGKITTLPKSYHDYPQRTHYNGYTHSNAPSYHYRTQPKANNITATDANPQKQKP